MTATRVLYNDSCPVCRAEIGAYASYCSAQGMEIGFDDLNKSELTDWGVTAEEAAMRLHVIKDGHVLSGVPAFMALWEDMPRYRWLARAVGLPGIRHLATFVYDRILAPALYGAHLRRQRRTTTRSAVSE